MGEEEQGDVGGGESRSLENRRELSDMMGCEYRNDSGLAGGKDVNLGSLPSRTCNYRGCQEGIRLSQHVEYDNSCCYGLHPCYEDV